MPERDWDEAWGRQRPEGLLAQRNAFPVRRQREAVAAALPPAPFRAIELGAGASTWLGLLAERGAWVAGIDLSVPGLAISRELGRITGTGAHLVRGDVLKPPFVPASFDVVFSAGLIEHFEEPTGVLKEALALLRPGGACITAVPNKRGLPGRLDKWLHPETYAGHVRFTPEELAEVHRRAGFEVLSSAYVGSFSLGARAPERGLLRLPYRAFRKVATGIVWGLMDLLRWYPESRMFSPALVAVARRPGEGTS